MIAKDETIRHRVELEKLKNQISEKYSNKLLKSYYLLKENYNGLDNKNINSILKEVNQEMSSQLKSIKKNLIEDNIAIAQYESKFQSLLISKLTNHKVFLKPVSKELAKVLLFDNLVQGELFDKTFSRLGQSFEDEISRVTRISILNGLTGKEAAAQVSGTFNIKANQLNSLTRTVIQNVTALSDEQTYKRNGNLIEKVRYVAVMDGRTTDICKSLNNKIFLVGEGPRPPQHFNCRSFTIPILSIDDEEEPVESTYNEWFLKQKDKSGIESKDKEKFTTNDKVTLSELERKL